MNLKSNRFFDLPSGQHLLTEMEPLPGGNSFSKYLTAHYQKIENVKKDITRLPEEEEFFFLQTGKQFNAFTFIPFVLLHQNARRLMAVTYSINKRVIEALVDLHRTGKVDEITLCVSDTMLKRNPVTTDLLAAVNSEYANINVLFAWVHAKVCLIETATAHYVVEGSGNWSENAAHEQYTFANSKGLFTFREKLLTETEIRYTVSNGEIVEI